MKELLLAPTCLAYDDKTKPVKFADDKSSSALDRILIQDPVFPTVTHAPLMKEI
jgi:hypothetical protein